MGGILFSDIHIVAVIYIFGIVSVFVFFHLFAFLFLLRASIYSLFSFYENKQNTTPVSITIQKGSDSAAVRAFLKDLLFDLSEVRGVSIESGLLRNSASYKVYVNG